MRWPDLYQAIYEDPRLFEEYLRAQSFTVPGKTAVARAVVEAVDLDLSDKTVGILPCDIGWYFRILRQMLPKNRFVLIDRAPGAITYIAQTCDTRNAALFVADVHRLDALPERMDVALCLFATHLLDLERFFAQVRSVLRPDGRLVLLTMSPEQQLAHPMSAFDRGGPSRQSERFLPLETLMADARAAGFEPEASRVITFDHHMSEAHVPTAFNRCANSLLFRQTPEDVDAFQRRLCASADADGVRLQFAWSLLVFRLEGRT